MVSGRFRFRFRFSFFCFSFSAFVTNSATCCGPWPAHWGGTRFSSMAATMFKEMQCGNFSRHFGRYRKLSHQNRSWKSIRKRKRLAIKKLSRIWPQLERCKDTAQMPATTTTTATKRELHNRKKEKRLGKTSISFTFLLHSVCIAAAS